jgi:Werner syndrome ATP-dependent helicase
LTATATPTVRDDILDSLHLKDPIIIVSSLDRPNLYISVGKKTGSALDDLKEAMIKTNENRLGHKFDGPAIIYCQLKQECENIKISLRQMGIKAETYHAGMEMEKRRTVQNDFMVDKIDVIVATVAFGMGLDKSNVRNVVHYGCPKDMESYYQEIGRAGRDGLPSKCAVFYSTEDYSTIR